MVVVVDELGLSGRQDGRHGDPDARRHIAPYEVVPGPVLHLETPCREGKTAGTSRSWGQWSRILPLSLSWAIVAPH